VKVLLTGPTGFIGSAFTRLVARRGHQVAGLVIPSEEVPVGLSASKDVRWLRGTLEQAPWDEISSFAPDACVHMAWITTPGIYLESPENERFRDSSLQFLRKVRELGAPLIVGLGTCIEYEINDRLLSEESTPARPASLYARCKNDLRLALEREAAVHGFQFCWTRVFYPYGPGEHPSRLCSSIIQKLSRNETITLKTPDSTKDYIFIEDLADALLTVIETRFQGVINLGTGIGLSVREIARTLARMMGKSDLIKELEPPEVDPLGYVVANVSRLQRLGWRPAHNLQQGLEKLLAARGT
jgi:nucleoside-diphosphate-sugar epimerase